VNEKERNGGDRVALRGKRAPAGGRWCLRVAVLAALEVTTSLHFREVDRVRNLQY
jgi:hypothetical protein